MKTSQSEVSQKCANCRTTIDIRRPGALCTKCQSDKPTKAENAGKMLSGDMMITLGKQKMPLSDILIPDLWHVGQGLKKENRETSGQAVLDCWHMAHSFQNALFECGALMDACQALCTIAKCMNDEQHAGIRLAKRDWAALHQATLEAQAALAKARGESEGV